VNAGITLNVNAGITLNVNFECEMQLLL
jgi:hypothetical protein